MLNNKHKAQLIIITAFILGIVVGASGQYLVLQESLNKSGNSSNSSREMLDNLSRTLKLTKEQRNEVEQITADSRAKYQELRIQTRPQYDAVRNETRKRISALLSPEQQALYEKWNCDLDTKREQKEKASATPVK